MYLNSRRSYLCQGDRFSVKMYHPLSIWSSEECINSTTTALMLSPTDNFQLDIVHIDFCKAFDSVPHNKLLLKLWNIGITGNLWKWFIKSYKVLGYNVFPLSTVYLIACLYYQVFLREYFRSATFFDIPKWPSLSYSFIQHVETFYEIVSELDAQKFQEDLSSVSKCIITCSDNYKELGIYFSDNLSWRLHLQSITSKPYKSFGLFCHIFKDVYCLKARRNL